MSDLKSYVMVAAAALATALPLTATTAVAPSGDATAVPRFASAPTIDGQLDEPSWAGAAQLGGFVQGYPDAGAPASLTTSVRLGFDATTIFLGIVAEDDPQRVRAALHARDDLGDDDVVAVYLDTFGDGSRAYVLRFNPLGVQQDGIFLEGSGSDLSVDLAHRSAGRLTSTGWEIEVAIPLASLRYPVRARQRFGLQVIRQSRHLGEESSWRALPTGQAVRFPLEHKLLLAGCGGLDFDDPLLGGLWLESTPTLTTRLDGSWHATPATGSARAGDVSSDGSPESRAGLLLRAGRGSNLVVNLAYRPDFGEVEADAPVVTANNPYPIFFAERRPFFLEGLDLWRTLATTVDTRRIETPESAIKGTWQTERDALAVLAARDGGDRPAEEGSVERADDALVRLRHSLGDEAWVGALLTRRQASGRENSVASVDGRFRLGSITTLSAQLAGSVTDGAFYDPDRDRVERRRARGAAYAADLDRTAERLALRLSVAGVSPDYRADLGYVSRVDTHRLLAEARYSPPARAGARLVSWSFLQTGLLRADSRGRMQYAYLWPHAELAFRGQTYLSLGPYLDYLKLVEGDYGARRGPGLPGAFFGADERSTWYHGGTVTLGTTRRSWSAEASVDAAWNTLDYDFGAGPKYPRVSPAALADPAAPLDPGTGDTRTATLGLRWQPNARWTSTLALTDDRLRRDDTRRLAYHTTVASLGLERHFSKASFLRLRLDHDSLAARTDAHLLFAFEPRLGTSLIVGYEDGRTLDGFDPVSGRPDPGWRQRHRSAFVKLSWRVRRDGS